MIFNVKKLFLFLVSKKVILSLILISISVGLLLPFRSEAGVADWFFGDVIDEAKKIGTYAAASIVFLIVQLITSIALFLAGLAGDFLNWVIQGGFTNFSYTNPDTNEVIKIGLNITQGFTNAILVLVLVWIGLAITLRLKDYEAKRVLPVFIIIALLVNFAPVFVGLVVDAANIPMKFFTDQITGENFTAIIKAKVSDLTAKFEWSSLDAGASNFTIAIILVTVDIFLIVLALVLFLFAFLFMIRYLAIWLLVILSPIAFASYILPKTKQMIWDTWIKQLIQWAFVGLVGAFFLYLSFKFVIAIGNLDNPAVNPITTSVSPQGGAETEAAMGSFNVILSYVVALAFLMLGFIFAIKTSAMGASGVIGAVRGGFGRAGRLAKKGGIAVGTTGIGAGVATAGWGFRKAVANMPGVRKWGERQMATRKWGKGETGIKGFVKRTAATVMPVRYARRGLGALVSKGVVEREKATIKQAEESVKDTDTVPKILGNYHSSIDDSKRIGYLNKLIEKGDIDDAMDEKKHGKSAIPQDEMQRVMKKAKKWESEGKIQKAIPHLTDDPAKIIEKMKPADYKNISKEALKDVRVMDAILETAMGAHISKLMEDRSREAADAIESGIRSNAKKAGKSSPEAWIKDKNKRLHKYITQGAGRGLIDLSEDAKESPVGDLPLAEKYWKRMKKQGRKPKIVKENMAARIAANERSGKITLPAMEGITSELKEQLAAYQEVGKKQGYEIKEFKFDEKREQVIIPISKAPPKKPSTIGKGLGIAKKVFKKEEPGPAGRTIGKPPQTPKGRSTEKPSKPPKGRTP